MNRTKWLVAVAMCDDGHAMEYVEDCNSWVCLKDAGEIRGETLARERGFDTTMHFAA